VLLPVGISFYTFQTLSYTVDVYRGERHAERHLGIFALYVSFFPQLVAGPIERSTRLLPQFHNHVRFDYDRVTSGLRLMLWGFFKKVVIADNVALAVNAVYNDPTRHEGLPLILATILFAFQIYCDFAGYSDIAIGGARILGFDLMTNFRRPYHARSIGEFWHRWHISLSTWFRDYLYIPLGGNRVGRNRWLVNLFLTFLISGLWHGASWTFVVWGALHGGYLIVGILTAGVRARAVRATRLDRVPWLHGLLQRVFIFGLVCFAWIFFRANSVADALYIVTHLFTGIGASAADLLETGGIFRLLDSMPLGLNRAAVIVGSILLMEVVHLVQTRGSIGALVAGWPVWCRWPVYYALLAIISLLGAFNEGQQFIYFQF
jgi:D-alanyl-lipoteichoic acid acyltransferase DltB (MBOAT superfamily)